MAERRMAGRWVIHDELRRHPPGRGRTRGSLALVLSMAFALAASSAGAQAAGACMRIAFGSWSPSLDWRRAGHPDSAMRVGSRVRQTRDSVFSGQASASGRDEMQWDDSAGVRRLFLTPAWWPAGVVVAFDTAARGDTLLGEATAFVADGRERPPRALARVIRSGCATGR